MFLNTKNLIFKLLKMDSLYSFICCRNCRKRKPQLIYDTELTESLLTQKNDDDYPIESVNQLKIRVRDYVVERKQSIKDIYHIQEELGTGSFGVVHKIIHKVTNEIRAMKQIKLISFSGEDIDSELEAEINILKNLDHPNILKIYE